MPTFMKYLNLILLDNTSKSVLYNLVNPLTLIGLRVPAAINFPDMTSKFRALSVFVIVYTQNLFHTECNGYILRSIDLARSTKGPYKTFLSYAFLDIYYHIKFQVLMCAGVAPSSDFRTTAILILSIVAFSR
jgi:hypothetical protein